MNIDQRISEREGGKENLTIDQIKRCLFDPNVKKVMMEDTNGKIDLGKIDLLELIQALQAPE